MGLIEIPGYPDGSDITLLDCYYIRPVKMPDGKYTDDMMVLLFIDNTDRSKHHVVIPKPKYQFYEIKGEFVEEYSQLYIEKEHVIPHIVPYSKIDYEVAKVIDQVEKYKQNKAEGDYKSIRQLHKDPRLMNSDMDIENHYRFHFGKQFKNDVGAIRKGFYDIEVDTKYMAGNFVELGECPVNAITFHDEFSNNTHTLLLRDKRNPLIEPFEKKVISGEFSMDYVRQFVIDNVGGRKRAIINKLIDTEYHIHFFDSEIDLIRTFFLLVHKYSPDFCMGWNSSAFDLAYLIERCYVLGYEPADILTDPRWEISFVRNYVDTRNLNDLAERGDFSIITGNTVWIDQMIQFASRRKAKMGSFTSFKLDDIGFQFGKVRKLSYAHITNNIALLPYLDYTTFVLYNIMDVAVQKCIEMKNKDIEYIFSKAIINNTSYKKVHRQTVYLINRMCKSFDNKGFVIGNNVNRWNDQPDKFAGALVGDPMRTDNYSKIKAGDRFIMVCDNLQDFDFKSLYPSIDIENNIAPNTQIGRIEIANQVYDHENVYCKENYSRGGEYIENLRTDNHIEFCHRWLHLANFTEMLEDIKEYNTGIPFGGGREHIYDHVSDIGVIEPLYYESRQVVEPLNFNDNWEGHGIWFFSTLEQNQMSSDYKSYIKEAV